MKPAPGLIVLSAMLGVSVGFAQSVRDPVTSVQPTTPASTTGAAPSAVAVAATTVTAASATTRASAGAIAVPANPGTLPTVVFVTPTVVPVTTTVVPVAATSARLVNLSTRARVTAADPLITGFTISGTGELSVLVRAAGPALAGFGVSDALAAPRLDVRDASGALVLSNAGWNSLTTLANAFATTGAFPFASGSADAAAIVSLRPGNYTVQISDASSRGAGVALAEIYDMSGAAGPARLTNVSTRTTVAASGGELISGFVLAGTAAHDFLMRGVGPGLEKLGVRGTLSDPVLTAFDTSGRQVATNDDWSGSVSAGAVTSTSGPVAVVQVVALTAAQVAAASATGAPLVAAANTTGAFPLDLLSRDAALVTTLAPGAYTVQVRGADVIVPVTVTALSPGSASGTTGPGTRTPAAPGTALLEIYELP